jgi:hypothetical protein
LSQADVHRQFRAGSGPNGARDRAAYLGLDAFLGRRAPLAISHAKLVDRRQPASTGHEYAASIRNHVMSGESQDQDPQDRRKTYRRKEDKEMDQRLSALEGALASLADGFSHLSKGHNEHLVDCSQRHQNHADAITENTRITEGVSAGVATLRDDLGKVLRFLQPELTAEERRARAWKALSEFFEILSAFLHSRRASPALWILTSSAAVLVLWAVGGFQAVRDFIGFMRAVIP